MEILPPEAPKRTRETPLFAGARMESSIFYGPNGLRAGWSVLLYIGVLMALLYLAGFELHWFARYLHRSMPGQRSGEAYPTLVTVVEAMTLLAVVLATAGMARVERCRVAFYGLIGSDRVRQFFIGIASGFAFISLLVGILLATHHLELSRSNLPVGQTAIYAAAWGLCFLLVGMTEELMFRGYPLFTLARGIRFWPAAFLLAATFGLLHMGNHGESPFGLVAAMLIALVFSLSLWRLGHLWWAIGFHAAWDWGESFFYGTPDSGAVSAGRLMHAHPSGAVLLSGGTTGPEGSGWVLLVIALAALFVWVTQPRHGIRLAEKERL